jgi:hypothetical protein
MAPRRHDGGPRPREEAFARCQRLAAVLLLVAGCLLSDAQQQQPQPAEQFCLDCPPGQELGDGMCQDCQRGAVSDPQTGRCETCDEGKVPGERGHECEYCPPGKQSAAGRGACEDCGPGQYSGLEGSCATCDEDGMVPNEARTLCEFCPPGYEEAPNATQRCRKCAPGNFSTLTTNCAQCPDGKYPTNEQTVCTYCDPVRGLLSARAATILRTLCQTLPAGHAADFCITF